LSAGGSPSKTKMGRMLLRFKSIIFDKIDLIFSALELKRESILTIQIEASMANTLPLSYSI
jgi:hypothetical protein